MTITITRFEPGPRMSQAVAHGDRIYLAGMVGTEGADITEQAKTALAEVDRVLAAMGSGKSSVLKVVVWLADMADFAAMNAVWDGWVPQGHTPARATGEAKLAAPEYLVEIIVTAAQA